MMQQNGGMVAVVHGIRDSGLTVTLLEGGNQYTLMPNNRNDRVSQQSSAPFHLHPSVHCASQCTPEECSATTLARNRDNGIQATDDRYASTYKTMHCNVKPTSPLQDVTEFPPQRPEVVHGHGNFVVGGYGSGETAQPAVKANSFRGGMVWPDRGSVCASRASVQSDAFANSLRKYPSVSPDRSTEIIERLISFTQAKNASRTQNTCSRSPNHADSEYSKQTFVLERNPSRSSVMGRVIYQPDCARKNPVSDNSSTRQRSRNLQESDDSWNRPLFCKSNDVRCIRDNARKFRQGCKNLVSPPMREQIKYSSSSIRDQHDYDVHLRKMYEQERESNNSVNMEIQAAAQMESKEILTLPRIVPMQRTIATPLSPIPSKIESRTSEALVTASKTSTRLIYACSCKSIQVEIPLNVHLGISSSSFDLCHNNLTNKTNKKSRSEVDLGNIKKTVPHAILTIMQNFNNNTDVKEFFKQLKRSMSKNKNMCRNCKHIFENFDLLRRSVSNNTYFRENFEYDIEQDEPSKHFKSKLKYDYKNQNSEHKQQQAENQPVSLTRLENDNYSGSGKIKTSKPNERSTRTKYDNNHMGCLKKVPERKRWHGERNSNKINKDHNEDFVDVVNANNNNVEMNAEEIRNLIDLDILAFTEKYRINITTESLDDLIEKVLDLFVRGFNGTSIPNKTYMTEKLKKILRNRGLSKFQSIYLSNILTNHWEEEFLTCANSTLKPLNYRSETLIVLPNITQNSSFYGQSKNNTNVNNYSINEMSQKDIDANIKTYTNEISNEINKWLSNLQVLQPEEKELQRSITDYLASDIVDRQKYLALNPSSEISDTSELEHLKYQIFKMIYKFSIVDMSLLDHVTDLMRRIQSITVPAFSVQRRKLGATKSFDGDEEPESSHRLKIIESSNIGASSSRPIINSDGKCCQQETCKRNLIIGSTSKFSSGRNVSLKDTDLEAATSTKGMTKLNEPTINNAEYNNMNESKPKVCQMHPSCTNTFTNKNPNCSRTLFSGGIKIRDDDEANVSDKNKNITNLHNTCNSTRISESNLNADFTQYLKAWVEKIPLPMTSAEEQTVVKTLRTGIYSGILEAVTKLRSNPDTFNDRFLFEDLLDDEIEKLLSNLPRSPELSSKKYVLKVRLIEKTNDFNELLKSASGKSYKQELVETLKSNLPQPNPQENENPDILQIYEELQILNLVEDFIICSNYENVDQITAEAYKKKLIKHTQDFVEELKANHSKALMNIDKKLYLQEILDVLKKVPLPSDKTIQEEADEILLLIEIDKWFRELPLIQNDDFVEQLHRKRLENNLAKHILELERGSNNTSSVSDNSLKHEISQFLERAPLQQGQSVNINVMVNDLAKRIKQRPRPTSIINNSKNVAFSDTDYEKFNRNMPLCSTYTSHPNQNLETSYRRTETISPTDPSVQMDSGHYHNISKPLFDDLRLDQSCCNTDLSLQEVPNYDTFDNTRPRSSSIKGDIEPQWYTLQETRQENPQANNLHDNIRNLNRTEQNNKAIQVISPNEQSHSRHYHNIAQPLLDDLRLDSKCCNEERLNNDTFSAVQPINSLYRGDNDATWHTLQQSRPEYSQLKIPQFSKETSDFSPYPINTSHNLNNPDNFNDINQYNMAKNYEEEFIVPQHYVENKDVPYQKYSPKRTSEIQNQDPTRKSNSHIMNNQRFFNAGAAPQRYDSPRLSQPNIRLDPSIIPIPHRIQHQPVSPNRFEQNSSTGFQNIVHKPQNPCSQMNQSNVYHKSTDRDGIRQTIERNKTLDTNLVDSSPLEHHSGYSLPSMHLPPGYVPLRMGTTKGVYFPVEEEESEEENIENNKYRCRCIEMVRNQRRHRYCPYDQHDSYPMCLTPQFFYPYFY